MNSESEHDAESDEVRLKRARLSWRLPLWGFAATALLNLIAGNTPFGTIGIVAWHLCVIAGLVFSITALIYTRQTRACLKHGIIGLVMFGAAALMFLCLSQAVSHAIERAERVRLEWIQKECQQNKD